MNRPDWAADLKALPVDELRRLARDVAEEIPARTCWAGFRTGSLSRAQCGLEAGHDGNHRAIVEFNRARDPNANQGLFVGPIEWPEP